MSLFQASVLKKYLSVLNKDEVSAAYQKYKLYFQNKDIQKNIRESKEEQFQEGFLRELFVNILGYTINPSPDFNLTTELKNLKGSKKADGAILKDGQAVGVIELKSTKTKDLESIRQQAFDYKANHESCKYVVTSNFEKLRFYIDNAVDYEDFDLFYLDIHRFELLYFCLSCKSILSGTPAKAKQDSLVAEETVTKQLYKDYSAFKHDLYGDIVDRNIPVGLSEDESKIWKKSLFKKTQKLLDRFLFVFFAEDRGLLDPNTISREVGNWERLKDLDEYRPLYERYKKLFDHINRGFESKDYQIFEFNGGLFREDSVLDNLVIDDDVLKRHTMKLTAYDFETEVDVNILGHIFEHSLGDIEAVHAELDGVEKDKKKSRRKKEGVYYTPKYITQYIVENTVGALCSEKKKELEIVEDEYVPGLRKNVLKSLLEKLDQYRSWLLELTILDPACGSGAFLIQALDFLIREHKTLDEMKAGLYGEDTLVLPEVENTILEKNIYGVDINDEAVDIAKLSLWLHTAKKGRKLSKLSDNIKCGNSLIDDPAVAGDKAFIWEKEFPHVFAKGGFDVVIGNPPYVFSRGDMFSEQEKAFFYRTCKNLCHQIHTFAVFIERAYSLLKQDGRLGYIVPNNWLTLDLYRGLREFLLKNTGGLKVISLGDYVFDNVAVDNCLLTYKRGYDATITLGTQNGNADLSQLVLYPQIDKSNILAPRFYYQISVNANVSYRGILAKVVAGSCKLSEIATVKSGVKVYEIGAGNPKQTQEMKKGRVYHSQIKLSDSWYKYIDGENVNRYFLSWNKEYVKYGDNMSRKREERFFSAPRVLVRQIPSYLPHCINASYSNEVIVNDLNSMIILDLTDGLDPMFLVAMLNSKLLSFWFYYSFDKMQRKVFPQFRVSELRTFPIRKPSDLCHSKIVQYSSIMHIRFQDISETLDIVFTFLRGEYNLPKIPTKLKKFYELDFNEFFKALKVKGLSLSQKKDLMTFFEEEKAKALDLKREIDRIDNEIDQLVYQLYELTDEEIALVESSI